MSDIGMLWYGAEWVVRLCALAVVPIRRSPAATRSWLLLIFFLPLPGLVLFLLFGTSRFPTWRRERFRKLLPFFHDTQQGLAPFAAELGDLAPVAGLAERLGALPAVSGNAIELIDDYDAVMDRLVADIDAATVSVEILVYIFADDAVGRRVADALGRAVMRGVRARVMFDPVGSRRWRKGTLRMLAERGVAFRQALPPRWFHHHTRGDMRNHRKLFVVDERIGYAGSQNLVAKDFRPGIVNRELVARLTGPIVAELTSIARADWSMEDVEHSSAVPSFPAPTGSAVAQLLPSGADYSLAGFETLLVWQLHQARRHVVIVTPYFIPDADVLAAMTTACARGVVVDLVLSEVVDQRLVNWSQSSYYDGLLASGVRINLFRDYLLHAKNVSIDGRLALVGSSNVDLRSFNLNEESSIVLYDTPSVGAVEAIQRGYLRDSDRLDLVEWRRRPRRRKFVENVARLVDALL